MVIVKTEIQLKLEPGMVFKAPEDYSYYLLAQCTEDCYALIGLTTGNRWDNPQSMEKIEESIVYHDFIYIGYLNEVEGIIKEGPR